MSCDFGVVERMRLADWRREQGLSQADLAEKVPCVQSLISLIERATDPRIPSTEIMIRIYIVTRGAVTLEDLAFPNGLPDLDTPELPLAPAAAPLFDGKLDAEPGTDAAILQDAA